MIVVKEIAEARGRDDLRSQGNVGAHVIRRVGSANPRPCEKPWRVVPSNIGVEKVRRFWGDWVRCGKVGPGLSPILIQPRSEESNLRRQSEIEASGAEVLLAVLGEVLFPETIHSDKGQLGHPATGCRFANVGSEIHRSGGGLEKRRKAHEKPQTILYDRAAHAEAGLSDTEMVLLRRIDLRIIVQGL